jgi:hypothetical protein
MQQLRGIVQNVLMVYRAPELSGKMLEHIGQMSGVRESGRRCGKMAKGVERWPEVQEDDRRFEELSRSVER